MTRIIFFILFLTLPLYIDPNLHSQNLCKLIILNSLLPLVLFFSLRKRLLANVNLTDIFLLLLLAWSLFVCFFAKNKYISFFGCYNRNEGFLTFLNYVIIYLLASFLIKTRSQAILLLKILLFSSLLPLLYGYLQFFGFDIFTWEGAIKYRSHSTFANPVFFGGFLVMLIFIPLYLYFSQRKNIWLLLFLALYLGLLFTRTRGAILGGFLTGLFFLILYREKIFAYKAGLLKVISGVCIIGLLINLNPQTSFIKRFAHEIVEKKQQESGMQVEFVGGAGGRVEIYKATLNMIKDNFLFGVGLDCMEVVFPSYKTVNYVRGASDYNRSNRAHNEFLEYFVTRGILGGLLFLLFVSFSIINALFLIRKGERFIIPYLCIIFAYILQGMFAFGTICMSGIFFCSLGIINGFYKKEKKDYFFKIPLGVFIIFFIVSIFYAFKTIYDFLVDRRFQLGQKYKYSGYEQEAQKIFQEVIKKNPREHRYWDPVLSYLLEKDPARAIDLIKKALKTVGDDYVLYFYLGIAEDRLGRNSLALKYYKKAIKLCPLFGDAYHNMADLYRRVGDFEKAQRCYEKALFINPNKNIYLDSYASFLISQGKEDEAMSLYQKISADYSEIKKVYKQLCALYSKRGNYNKLIYYCKRLLSLDESDTDALWGLAVGYFNIKDYKMAKEICEKLLTIQPQHAQAQRMLSLVFR